MTPFLDVAGLAGLVSRVGTGRFLRSLTDCIEADFLRWNAFSKAPRVASHSPLGVIEVMPTSDGKLYAFKFVNGHPANVARGLPTVMAFGALAEVDTGLPLLVSEMTLLTALRTAATSALAARLLARPARRTMALIGTGAQAEFQALAFHAVNGIAEIRAWDTDAAALDKFVRNMRQAGGPAIVAATSVADAVAGADIITTATADKRRAAILDRDLVRPGVHINAIGGDCPGKTELDPAVLAGARVFVEYLPQSEIEGEIQQLDNVGGVVELWRVLAGEERRRTRADEITIFDSVGFAIEDFSALRYVHGLVRAHGSATLDLVPQLADPKDLFSLVLAAGNAG
jgi:ornithine cyclodeaminase